MKHINIFQRTLSALVLLTVSSLSWAYDFEAKNADGVTIYYNLINNGTEAEVTYSIDEWTPSYFDEVITIPETAAYNGKTLSVTSIGDYAFYGCFGLTSVTIPESVTNIGDYAFAGCSSLPSVIIPNSVTNIGKSAFIDCRNLISVIIPEGVTSILYCTFYNCSSLTSVTIPTSVTSIGEGAFSNSGLISVNIPESVTSIYNNAFTTCSSLTSMIVDNGNPVYDSRDNCNAIIETASNTLVAGCQNTIIPESVTSIGLMAFYGCSNLTSVDIPNSVTSIGKAAFQHCNGLTSVNIPEGVTSIDEAAFQFCGGLTSVTIPNSMTNFGDWIFMGCYSLTSVYSLIENPFSISYVFFAITQGVTLYVPQGTKTAYESTEGWTEYFSNVVEFNATGINEINPGQTAESNAVYTLNGTKVNVKDGDLKSLPRGIYVVNGKKTIVK